MSCFIRWCLNLLSHMSAYVMVLLRAHLSLKTTGGVTVTYKERHTNSMQSISISCSNSDSLMRGWLHIWWSWWTTVCILWKASLYPSVGFRLRAQSTSTMSITDFIMATRPDMVETLGVSHSKLCFYICGDAFVMMCASRTAATKKWHQPLINLFPIIVLQPPFKNMLVAGWWGRSFQKEACFRNHRLLSTGSQITRLLLACCRILSFLRASHPYSHKTLSGCIFVFVGLVPKFQNRKITQRELYDTVHKLGGRTKKNLPGNVKGRSSKKYIVLYQPTGKSVPAAIWCGLSQGHHVVSYDFLFDTMVRRISVDIKKYVLPLVSLRSRLTLAIPVHKGHFRPEITMTSLIKCPKRLRAKNMIRQKPGIPKHLTLAQFYAFRKRKALMKTKTMSLRECWKALGQYMSERKNLEEIEKCLTQIEYVTYCRNRTELLKRYGSLNKPSYLTVLRRLQSVRV